MEFYIRKLDTKDLENLEKAGCRIKSWRGGAFAVCDKPLEHYRENPDDYKRIGIACWVPAEIVEGNCEDHENIEHIKGAYLNTLFVNEKYRGKGLGKRLMEARLEDIAAEGFREVTAVTREDNDIINGILKKYGFEKVASEKGLLYHLKDLKNHL
ncbi:GNAT family N-acetyltransferase [Candidatus Woesearchaeota archaeon]|nr:GNAT family N-acetyltransferase [Candidatus Woesearchaeota archaeon]